MKIKTFDERLEAHGLYPLKAIGVETLQVNLGGLCNQKCRHCHVSAGPERLEVMWPDVMRDSVAVLDPSGKNGPATLDITGGAPEMNSNYRWLVKEARAKGAHVKTRTNLTVLENDGMADLPRFWAEQGVEVIASLPCYTASNVDAQRGEGVFNKSIEALKALNRAGYGKDAGLTLNLVYNPGGAFLPGAQEALEADYKMRLSADHGVVFDNLFTITNMPVGRFMNDLIALKKYGAYMHTLADAFNPAAAKLVMCRTTLSVGFDGRLYDCDFNQQLGLGLAKDAPAEIFSFDMGALAGRTITTGEHCYGCTAGCGSSCTGELAGGLKGRVAA